MTIHKPLSVAFLAFAALLILSLLATPSATAAGVIAAPVNFQAQAGSQTSIPVTWSAPLNASGIKGYKLFYGTISPTLVASTARSYTFRFLNCGTSYQLSIVSVGKGNLLSAPVRVTASTAPCSIVGTPPINTALPLLSGTAKVGESLQLSNGFWSGVPTSYSYQWRRCDAAGANCANIANAIWGAYPVVAADAGSTLRAVVTASNSSGSGSAASVQSEVVAAAIVIPPADTTAPLVSLSAPVAGASVSGPVTLAASASDNVGVAGVSFKVDGVAVGSEDLSSPFSVSFESGSVVNGDHSVVAVARDAAGNSTASAPVSFTIANPIPPVNLALPLLSGTAQVGSSLSVSNGFWSGVPTSYSYQWQRCDASGANCANVSGAAWGAYSLVAADAGSTVRAVVTASNGAGSSSAASLPSALVAPEVVLPPADTTAPSVSLTAPAAGSSVSGAITFAAGASDNVGVAGVSFKVDGVAVGAEDTVSPYSLSWSSTSAANGSHSVTAIARDAAGNTATSAAVSFTVSNPSPPVNTSAPLISGTAKVGSSLQLSNGFWSGVPTSYSYQWRRCDAAGANCVNIAGGIWGAYPVVAADVGSTLRAMVTATNSVGSTAASSVQSAVVVAADGTTPPPSDTTAPSVSLTAPAAGSTIGGVVSLSADASDNVAVAGVTFKVDGAAVGAEDTSSPYSVSWSSASVANGAHSITAVARDTSGNSATAAARSVTVSNSATLPPPPAGNLGTSLPARLPASSGAGGTYYVDGVSGVDTNAGSSASPWKTINKALATVPLSGSIIRVRPGTYSSSGTNYAIRFDRLGNKSDPVTLMADTPGTVSITNANPAGWTLGGWIRNASGLRIQDFSFRIMANPGSNVGGDHLLIENSDRIEMYRNTFYEVAGLGITVRGGMNAGEAADDVWVFGNTFRSSTSNVYAQVTGRSFAVSQYFGSKGSHWVYAGQVGNASNQGYTSGTERFVAANNVFSGTAAGRHLEFGPQARNSFAVHNTFFGNHSGDTLGWGTAAAYAGNGLEFFTNVAGASFSTSYTRATNNLFVDLNGHAAGGSGPSEIGNVVERNMAFDTDNGKGYSGNVADDFDQNYGASILFTEGTGNTRANPLLSSPTTFDFSLQSGSPAVGAANPAYSPATDLSGKARDSAPDMGAYER